MTSIIQKMAGVAKPHICRLAAVLALTLGLVSTGWAAVKPAVVWNGDISSDTLTRNGFTLVTNDNTVAGGKITLVSTAKGVTLAPSSGGFGQAQGRFTAVVGYSNIVANAKSGALWTLYTNRDGDTTGVSLNDYSFIGVNLGNANYTLTTSGTFPSDGGLYYVGAYFSTDRVANYSTLGGRGTYAWVKSGDTAISAGKDGLVYSQESTYYGMTFGGFKDESGHQLTDAVISYIAYFTNQQEVASTTVSTWSLSNMKTVGTDIGAATAETGVNLPASATLTASVSPAAVFVQQTSTLTMTGSASLTINSGTGPLYVADGTTLTIDATGITSLTDQNPSVTLVSAKIYGTDLITVKAPVVSGGRVTASVAENGVTLSYSVDNVTFTSPFTGSALAAPTTATGYGESATEISFGNNEKFNQTIGDRTAIVVDIIGGTYEKLNGFLRTAENTEADARSKDVYLALTGGTANRVSGVQDCTVWSNAGTTTTTGDSIVQVQDGATVDFVYGAGGAGGYSGYQVVVNGSSGVTIKGGTVRGSVVGGWTSSHNLNPTVNYDTAVLVETVLGTATAATGTDIPAGYIIGGSAYNRNSSSASTVGRNSFVTLSLAGKSGAFDRTIIGGSAQVGGATSGNQAVTGNSSVTITAANDVSFANPIIGGGAKLVYGGQGSVTVGGNSSVTISGGTYTGRIVAGGYAPNGGTANVSGTATLTLNSGVFTGATLAGGNATGAKTLVVGDDLDISGATVTGFTAVTLGDGATAQMETGDEGTVTLGSGAVLKLIIEDADIADGYTPSVSGSGTVEYYEYVESVLTKITDAARLDGNNLRATAPVWSPAEANASGNLADTARWSTGALPANDTAIVKMVVSGSNTLTVNETRAFGHLYVEGSGTLLLEGDGTHHLTVGNLNIASGVTVTINDADDPLYVTDGTIDGSGTLTLANGANLTLDGVTKTTSVSLTVPSGTTLTIGGDGTTTLPLGDRVIAGNIVIEDGATLVSTTNDAPDYDHACNVYIYGTLTLNARWSMNANNKIYCYTGATINGTGDSDAALDLLNQNTTIYVNPNPDTQAAGTVTCSARIRLRGNATVNVAEGMTFLQTGSTIKRSDGSDCGYTKTGGGVFHIKGSYEPRGTTTVSAGKILFEDVNFNTEANPGALAGTGTVEFKGSTDHRYFYGDATGFSGKFIVTKANNSKDVIFHGTASQFSSANPPEFEVSGGVVLTGKYDNKILPVKDFSGAGNISAAFGTVSSHVNRTIDTLQTKDTAFAGTFTYADNSSYHRNTALTVRGADNAESVCALTLSGVSTTYGPLMITNNAKVVFTSAGSWRNGQVTVGKDGWLESTNATVLTSLTLTDGANIVFPTSSSSLTGITSLTFTSGKTYISFADGAPDSGTLIDWSSVGSAPDGDFELVGDVAETHVLTKSATGLTIAKGVASVTTTSGVTHYSSVAVARLQAMNAGENLLYFTIVTGGDVSIAYFEGMKIKNAGGANITITGVSSEYTMNSSTEDGVTTYTRSNAPTAYVWTDAYSDFNMETYVSTPNHNWTVPGNWNVVGGTAAGRYPDAGDTVTFNDGATVTLNATASVAGGEVNGAVSISGSGVSLNVSGNITGSGTLTLSDVCLASAGAGITVAPAVNFTNDSELAGDNALTLNGDVAISDTFKVWNSNHAINGNVTINSGVTFKYGALLLINGAATVKGAFTRDAGSTSCIKFCGAVTIENGNVSIDGWQSGNLDDAATVVLAGANASLIDTRGIPIADNKVSTTVADSYVKKTGSTFAVAAKTVVTVSLGANVSLTIDGNSVADGATLKFAPGDTFTYAATPAANYTAAVVVTGGTDNSGTVTVGETAITVAATATRDAVSVSNVAFAYGNDYATATVTATVSDPTATYKMTVGVNEYTGSVSGTTVTFTGVETGHASAYDNVSYTITAKDGEDDITVTGGSGSAVVADSDKWVDENSGTTGTAAAGGSWSNAVTYAENVAAIEDNTFTALNCSTGDLVTVTIENVVYEELSDLDVSAIAADSQGAFAIGTVEDNNVVTTNFMVLAKENNAFTWKPATCSVAAGLNVEYDVVFKFDYVNGTYSVSINGAALSVNSSTSFALCASKTEVKEVEFKGSGKLSSILGVESTGYMVRDSAGHWYATIADAINNFSAANGPYFVLHAAGTPPAGWKIVTVDGVSILKKDVSGVLILTF